MHLYFPSWKSDQGAHAIYSLDEDIIIGVGAGQKVGVGGRGLD